MHSYFQMATLWQQLSKFCYPKQFSLIRQMQEVSNATIHVTKTVYITIQRENYQNELFRQIPVVVQQGKQCEPFCLDYRLFETRSYTTVKNPGKNEVRACLMLQTISAVYIVLSCKQSTYHKRVYSTENRSGISLYLCTYMIVIFT